MASQEYITIDNLTYKPIKNAIAHIVAGGGSLDEIQDDIDRANLYYEDLAESLEVDVANIQYPIPYLSMELLNYYVTWKYASENRGQWFSENTGVDVYEIMEENAYGYYRDTLLNMNTQYVSGTVEDADDRGVTFGGQFNRV